MNRHKKETMRIVQISDLHVLSPLGAEWRRAVFNKRITGFANVIRERGRVYREEYLRLVLDEAKSADHVLVTGDITNLALESEYERSREMLDEIAEHAEVTVIPGNHDIYLPENLTDQRFERTFSDFMISDIPELSIEIPAGSYPFVKLRGPLAIIGLSTAVPRPPFIASGLIGSAQLSAFRRVLAHPEVSARTPIILIHHDPLDSPSDFDQVLSGLIDAPAFRGAIHHLASGLVLYGHLHVRKRMVMPTEAGKLEVICASGGSLDHENINVRAGLNSYEFSAAGDLVDAAAWVVDPDDLILKRTAIPEMR